MVLTLEDRKKKVTSKNWTRETLAWAAGFLEGEGSFCFTCRKGKTRDYYLLSIQAGQHKRSVDVLYKLQSILGGTISGPYKNSTDKKGQENMLMWGIYKQIEVYAIIIALFPLLSSRRQTKCLELIEGFKKDHKVGRKSRSK